MPSAFFLSLLPLPFTSALARKQTSTGAPRHAVSASANSERMSVRSLLAHCFAAHGRHVAANQIRVLLICSVVMTTLLYPALAIHYETVSASANPSATDRPQSLALTPLLRPLFSAGSDAPAGLGGFPWQTGADGLDELAGWTLQMQPEGLEDGVRLETVWVGEVASLRQPSAPAALEGGRFDPSGLITGLSLRDGSFPGPVQCYPSGAAGGPWVAVSCAFKPPVTGSWDDAAWLRAVDAALTGTPHAIYGRSTSNTAHYLANHTSSAPSAASLDRVPPVAPHKPPPHPVLFLARSLLPFPVLALYSFLFIWSTRSLQHFTQMHNRIGVAFTYVVELAASTTCSGSLCVMLGWKLEGVPWFLLPFVITVVGMENMVHVTEAIVTTPVHMTVRERLGLGLSHAGPRITFTSLADIMILSIVGAVAGEKAGVVKEFCRFAIIVLVADWFLLFTFFTTVISIDMQRLELADVLRQGSPTTPQVPSDSTFHPETTPPSAQAAPRVRRRRRSTRPASKTSSEVLVSGFQAILRARTARNGSLMALMSLLVGLWYFYAGGGRMGGTAGGADGALAPGDDGPVLPLQGPLDPAALWRHLNPSNLPSIGLAVPAPIAVVVSTLPGQPSPSAYLASFRTPLRSVFSDRAPATWFLQVVCLPIAATTFVVYLILRYLLKDAELLDAQRDRLELGEEWDDEGGSGAGVDGQGQVPQPTMRTLPTAHQADIALLAACESRLLSVGLDGIALVWSVDDPAAGVPLPLNLPDDRVTHAALDRSGRYCALATAKGAVLVWLLGAGFAAPQAIPFPSLTAERPAAASASISSIEFLPPSPSATADGSPPSVATLVVVRENGEVAELNCRQASVAVKRAGTADLAVRATPLWRARKDEGGELDLALADGPGAVRVLRRDDEAQAWAERLAIHLEPGQRVSKVASALVLLAGAPQVVLAVTTLAGSITLWDANGTRLIALDPNLRRVDRLALVDRGVQECVGCGHKRDGFLLLAASADEAAFYRVTHDAPAAAACACPAMRRSMSTSTQRTSLDRPSFDSSPAAAALCRSRGTSFSTLVPPVSPLMHRRIPTSLSAASNLSADYPIAGHGGHRRRLSTRDKRAEAEAAEELLLDPAERRAFDGDDPFSSHSSPEGRSSSPPATLRSVYLGAVSVRKGAWDVLDTGQIVGVGRPRRSGSSSQDDASSVLSSAGTGSSSTTAKWRVWQVDAQRPSSGHDLAIAVSDMLSLKEDASEADRRGESPEGDASADGVSALRRRRAARVKAFSQQAAPVAPVLSHAVVSPLTAAGGNVAFAGMGNALCRFAFPATGAGSASPTAAPTPAVAMAAFKASPTPPRLPWQGPDVRRR